MVTLEALLAESVYYDMILTIVLCFSNGSNKHNISLNYYTGPLHQHNVLQDP